MNTTKALIKITEQLLTEIGGAPVAKSKITPSTDLEKDLGLASIERSELLHRVEEKFNVRLPDTILLEAKNIKELATAIEHTKSKAKKLKASEPEYKKAREDEPHIDITKAKSINEVIKLYGTQKPNQIHIRLITPDDQEIVIRYGELYEQACIVAENLSKSKIMRGDTIAIMLPTEKNFFPIFLGVLLAGAIPVPIYPPIRKDEIERYVNRQTKILQNAQARALVTFSEVDKLTQLVKPFIPSLRKIYKADDLVKGEPTNGPRMASSEDIGLIQYTSGSTGTPKGVVLTQSNLLANIRSCGEMLGVTEDDVAVSWLPLYHDMGLIGMWLGSLYHGNQLVLMSPLTFLARPERWLWAIHNYRGTISGSPNFGYEFCIRKVPDSFIRGLDLSSWRVAFNGAEAVRHSTIERFSNRFKHFNFREEANFPVYGLAESTVGLAFPQRQTSAIVDYIEREALTINGVATPAKTPEEGVGFVGCGQAIPGHEIRIVDEESNLLPERKVGEIQFRGPSSMQGYYRNSEATEAVFDHGWWRTGDLGYIANNNIFITGRKKDVIVKAGHNIYPDEVETLAGEVEGIRKGCVIAFGSINPVSQKEKFILVAEINPGWKRQRSKIKAKVIEAIGKQGIIKPDEVVLVSPHRIPKTSSGKLQRHACKQAYEEGKLKTTRHPGQLQQLISLTYKSLGVRLKRLFSKSLRLVYTLYFAGLLLASLPFAWMCVHILPLKYGRKFARAYGHFLLFMIFSPVEVHGKENLRKESGVIACNHASYLDPLILLAYLPTNTSFVGKIELAKTPILGSAMKKLGHITISRENARQSFNQLQQMKGRLSGAQYIAIYPEGTFTGSKGLRSFKLGAFKLAAEANVPVYPLTLVGTREMLPGDSFLVRPKRIKMYFSEPIMPEGDDWQAFTKLRDKTFDAIAKHSDEM